MKNKNKKSENVSNEKMNDKITQPILKTIPKNAKQIIKKDRSSGATMLVINCLKRNRKNNIPALTQRQIRDDILTYDKVEMREQHINHIVRALTEQNRMIRHEVDVPSDKGIITKLIYNEYIE